MSAGPYCWLFKKELKMSYDLTEEQQMLKDTVARIAKEQIAPGAEKRDEEAKFPWDMVEVLRENALFGADFPEKYGGSEMGLFSLCPIVEEIAKTFISHADVAEVICIAARTDTSLPATKGSGIFIVEKGTPGFSIGKHENKLGIRASSTVEIILEDVRVPAANILIDEGMGFPILMKTLDLTRIPVAAQAVGIAQGALDYAVQYTKERTQFGKPIFSFQGLQWMMADMITQVEAARQLVYKTASLFEGLPKNLDRLPKETIRYSAMAKLFAAETAMKVTTDAVQLLGGYGYVREYPVERMMRDAKITQIYEGTSQIQKVVIASTL